MEHKYIDKKILRQFDKSVTIDDILEDLIYKYKITNVEDWADEEDEDDWELENWYYLADALLSDIEYERANYKAYIEEGMDARLLIELRKSAVIPMAEDCMDFYDKHKSCNTAEDVKKLRVEYLHFVNSDYRDDDWQYYLLILYFLGRKSKEFNINFEYCFKDCDNSKITDNEYIINVAKAHLGTGPLDGILEWEGMDEIR